MSVWPSDDWSFPRSPYGSLRQFPRERQQRWFISLPPRFRMWDRQVATPFVDFRTKRWHRQRGGEGHRDIVRMRRPNGKYLDGVSSENAMESEGRKGQDMRGKTMGRVQMGQSGRHKSFKKQMTFLKVDILLEFGKSKMVGALTC